MVLLLLTCARHLIVNCTALKFPIYVVILSSGGHQVVQETVLHPPHTHPSLFPSCPSSVIRSVTSPIIHPCVCELWLFVLKHTSLVDVCRLFPPPPPPRKKKKHLGELQMISLWVLPDFLCSFTSPAFICSFIRSPSIHQSTIGGATGLESSICITWRRDGYEENCRALLQVLWVEKRIKWPLTSLLNWSWLGRPAAERGWLGIRCPSPLPVSHTDMHVTYRHER